MLCEDRTKKIDFESFLIALSSFNSGEEIPKLQCMYKAITLIFSYSRSLVLFRIYDQDNDGYISRDELFATFQTIIGKDLNDQQLNEIVERTMLTVDRD